MAPHRSELSKRVSEAFANNDAEEAACLNELFDVSFMMTEEEILDCLSEASISRGQWKELLGTNKNES